MPSNSQKKECNNPFVVWGSSKASSESESESLNFFTFYKFSISFWPSDGRQEPGFCCNPERLCSTDNRGDHLQEGFRSQLLICPCLPVLRFLVVLNRGWHGGHCMQATTRKDISLFCLSWPKHRQFPMKCGFRLSRSCGKGDHVKKETHSRYRQTLCSSHGYKYTSFRQVFTRHSLSFPIMSSLWKRGCCEADD